MINKSMSGPVPYLRSLTVVLCIFSHLTMASFHEARLLPLSFRGDGLNRRALSFVDTPPAIQPLNLTRLCGNACEAQLVLYTVPSCGLCRRVAVDFRALATAKSHIDGTALSFVEVDVSAAVGYDATSLTPIWVPPAVPYLRGMLRGHTFESRPNARLGVFWVAVP